MRHLKQWGSSNHVLGDTMATDLEAMTIAELIRHLAEVEDALRAYRPTLIKNSDHLAVNPSLLHLAEREKAISAELDSRRRDMPDELRTVVERERRQRRQSVRPLA